MTKLATKPNCYKCVHRGGLPGNVHSCCKHPDVESATDNPLGKLVAMFASVNRMPPIQATDTKVNVKGNRYGIQKGWFNWPWNFDPTWLESCDGFTPKEESNEQRN